MMVGVDKKLWIHEIGYDAVDGISVQPIRSYFETGDLSSVLQGEDSTLRIERIEPDFIQSGEMTVQVTGRANPRAAEIVSHTVTFPDTPTEPFEEVVVFKEQRREIRVKFQSDTIGGDYQMGQIIANVTKGDRRVI